MRRLSAIFLLLVALGLGLPASTSAQDHYPNPAGTWTVKVLFDGDFELAYLQNFTLDGRTVLLLPTGPDHPNEGDSRVGCMGEWQVRRGRGPREYDFTARCLYNQDWNGVYGETRAVMRLNQAGTQFTADFTYSDYGADGTLLFSGPGVMTAERVVVRPLP